MEQITLWFIRLDTGWLWADNEDGCYFVSKAQAERAVERKGIKDCVVERFDLDDDLAQMSKLYNPAKDQ